MPCRAVRAATGLAPRRRRRNRSIKGAEGIEQRKLVAEAVKASLGVAAGIGAVVALTVAYRRHRIEESQSRRDDDRLFTDRFQSAAEQLAHDRAAVRLAGVHALAHLADDWEEQRQTCIDVLCAYVRLPPVAKRPPDASPSDTAPGRDGDTNGEQPTTPPEEREVRQTIVRVITDHLRVDPEDTTRVSWQGHDFDFTGAVFDGGRFNFGGARFSGGRVGFRGATFSDGWVGFIGAAFSDGWVDFRGATFSGSTLHFTKATFSGGWVNFDEATFSGGKIYFGGARFSRGTVSFRRATFSGGEVHFWRQTVSGGEVFGGGTIFSGGWVDFREATFSGGEVDFARPTFSGGTVTFDRPTDWSHPPTFDRWQTPPPGLILPSAEGASGAAPDGL